MSPRALGWICALCSCMCVAMTLATMYGPGLDALSPAFRAWYAWFTFVAAWVFALFAAEARRQHREGRP